MVNPLRRLEEFGQSVWMDFISREVITSGRLAKMIEEDGLKGVTSNPTIFNKSIGGSHDYDESIAKFLKKGDNTFEVMQDLMVEDVQMAADVLGTVYNQTHGKDGYVSLEVSPHLARDTRSTIEEARRLWAMANRPNVMIKVPGTQQGIDAITELTIEGVNINVTLLFGLSRYKEVADAYVRGLEARAQDGRSLNVASVASLFLSRIDVLVDGMLEEFAKVDNRNGKIARELMGKTAIASAKAAYQIYIKEFGSARFKGLENFGAKPQRVLWASTSTKNPNYSDTMYVEPLIGTNTINTMPIETLDAYRDHGNPQPNTVEEGIEDAYKVLDSLQNFSIEMESVAEQLESEGIEKFQKPNDELMKTLDRRISEIQHGMYAGTGF